MKAYRDLAPENEDFIEMIIAETNLPNVAKIQLVSDDELKTVMEVKKNNPLAKHISSGIDIVIIVNEEVFDRIQEDDMKTEIVKEAIHPIQWNSDKDIINIEQSDINTFSSYIQNINITDYIRRIETVKAIYSQLEDGQNKKVGKPKNQ